MMRRNGIIELLIILCALLIRTSSTTYRQSNFSKIIYISFETKALSEALPTKGQRQLYATHTDDTPYSLVKLPWAFNFFGNNIYNIFVNPNGALHQSKVPSTVQGPYAASLNTTYHGVIAGYLADLNPAIAIKTANITSFVNDSMVSIRYHVVPIFERKNELNVSFRITLFKDSRVVIDYDNIISFPNWLSGIRAPLYNNFSEISKEQKNVGRFEWNTIVSGVYPSKSNAKTGYQFITCPMSKVWGARFSFVPGSNRTLTLSPFLFSCHQYLDIAINLKLQGVPELVSSCDFKVGSPANTLDCDLSKLPSKSSVAVGNIFWRLKGSNAAYKAMAVDQIPLNFTHPTVSAVDRYSMSAALAAGCTAKDLYTGIYTCLNLPCDNKTAILFKNPICYERTPNRSLDKCSTTLAYDMVNSKCCTIDEMDCAGLCYGKTQIGQTPKTNGTMECCVTQIVDCLGYCGGTAVRDACGECQGKNFKGTGCKTKVVLNTTTGPEKLFAKIDYADPRKLWSLQHINITNSNNVSVAFNISSTLNDVALGPHIGLSTTPFFVLGPNQMKAIVVNVSATALYNAHQTSWEVKTLQFFYWVSPKIMNADRFYFKVQILTGAGNCDAISNVGSCMRVPACILCASYPTLRVLQEVTLKAEGEEEEKEKLNGVIGISGDQEENEEEDENGLEQWKGEGGPDEWKYYYRRQLFTGLIPMALGTLVDPPLSGVCLNGFASSVCSLAQFSGGPESCTYTRTLLAITAFASIILALR